MDYDIKALMGTLNPQCRQSLEEAAALCVAHGHYSIEIEHFLLKLLERRNTDLDRILSHFGLTRGDMRRDLEHTLDTFKSGNKRVPTFSKDVRKLLQESWLCASLQMHSGRVRSGAILLTLRLDEDLKDRAIAAAPCLRSIDPEMLWRDLDNIIRNTTEAVCGSLPLDSRPPDVELAPEGIKETPALDAYTQDLTARASQGQIDPVIGRNSEIRQMIDILGRRRQNNPILTGEAGVGKTAVVEGLARSIVAGDVPANLRNVSIRALDLTLLQAGASVQGEFEKRLKAIINEVKALVRPVILFIDEAHMLIGAGGNAGISDAANILKPALARGELRTIAATTWAEYKRYFETDAALVRRFQVVKVEEPTPAVAVEILRGLIPNLERHHKVRITDGAVQEAVRLSSRYISGRHLPDSAISVLDTAGARVSMAQRSIPPALDDLNQTLIRLKEEESQLEREGRSGRESHQERLREIAEETRLTVQKQKDLKIKWQDERRYVDKIRAAEERIEQGVGDESLDATLKADREALAKLQSEGAMIPLEADENVVDSVVAEWTGIPIGRMRQGEVEAVLDLDQRLAEKVIGQRLAVDTIARRIRTSRAGLDDPGRPVGVFFLAGPSGVGKTEMGHAVADVLFGSDHSLIVINMSEYQEAHTVSQLKGAPPGYVGHGKGGILTEAVRRAPFSVVLLDEVEKAHPDVLEMFFQVFDKGTLEDGEGVVVDFRHTVILMTSNLAGDEIEALCRKGRADDATLLATATDVLDHHFPAALMGRVVVIPFGPLSAENYRKIAVLKLKAVCRRFEEGHGSTLTWDDDALDVLAIHCSDSRTGARQLDRILSHELLPALSNLVLERLVDGQPINDVQLRGVGANELELAFDRGPGSVTLTLPSAERRSKSDSKSHETESESDTANAKPKKSAAKKHKAPESDAENAPSTLNEDSEIPKQIQRGNHEMSQPSEPMVPLSTAISSTSELLKMLVAAMPKQALEAIAAPTAQPAAPIAQAPAPPVLVQQTPAAPISAEVTVPISATPVSAEAEFSVLSTPASVAPPPISLPSEPVAPSVEPTEILPEAISAAPASEMPEIESPSAMPEAVSQEFFEQNPISEAETPDSDSPAEPLQKDEQSSSIWGSHAEALARKAEALKRQAAALRTASFSAISIPKSKSPEKIEPPKKSEPPEKIEPPKKSEPPAKVEPPKKGANVQFVRQLPPRNERPQARHIVISPTMPGKTQNEDSDIEGRNGVSSKIPCNSGNR